MEGTELRHEPLSLRNQSPFLSLSMRQHSLIETETLPEHLKKTGTKRYEEMQTEPKARAPFACPTTCREYTLPKEKQDQDKRPFYASL